MSEDYDKFSYDHYNYVNQVFGDIEVRTLLHEIYKTDKNKHLDFVYGNIEEDGSGFEVGNDSFHHYLMNTHTGEKICSTTAPTMNKLVQNTNRDVNDTLCQSYSLMTYMGTPNKTHHTQRKTRQMEIIHMYRDILKNKEFIQEFKNIIKRSIKGKKTPVGNQPEWKEYKHHKIKKEYWEVFKINNIDFIERIHNTLNDWERFGYNYFIGNNW